MKITFDHNDQSGTIDLVPSGKSYRVDLDGKTVEVEILQAGDGKLDWLVDSRRVTAYVSSDNTRRWVTIDGQTLLLTKSSGTRRSRGGHHHAAGELTAPMPGQVRAVSVKEGETVTRGQTLLLLEAMKMEIRIQSPQDGVVNKLFVSQGQAVEREPLDPGPRVPEGRDGSGPAGTLHVGFPALPNAPPPVVEAEYPGVIYSGGTQSPTTGWQCEEPAPP